MKVLVTGGAGFIGSALVRQFISETDAFVINVDKLTYAGNLESLGDMGHHPRHVFEQVDICDPTALERVFREQQPEAVVHLAAESHVDRSIDGPGEFIRTNILGTYTLLGVARGYFQALHGPVKEGFRFLHVSTDEVYGSLGREGIFTEESPYRPNSPYAASKAASDHLIRAWHHTYGFPTITTNCSNNYGPYQFPEKLIPLMIQNALEERPLPVYGRGENVRDWLYVEDHARALRRVLERGKLGETYNIGGNNEKSNIEVVETLCAILDERHPRPSGSRYRELVTFVQDRPGHDFRYAINASKIEQQLTWRPEETFDSGLAKTVDWYLSNQAWCQRVQDGSYRRQRLGMEGVAE